VFDNAVVGNELVGNELVGLDAAGTLAAAEANEHALNHPGFGGGIDPTKGWSHVSTEEISA